MQNTGWKKQLHLKQGLEMLISTRKQGNERVDPATRTAEGRRASQRRSRSIMRLRTNTVRRDVGPGRAEQTRQTFTHGKGTTFQSEWRRQRPGTSRSGAAPRPAVPEGH